MTAASPDVVDWSRHVRYSESPEGLAAVHDGDCAAIIWSRRPAARFQEWIDDIEPERLPQARLMLRPGQVREAIAHICDQRGTPDCFERDLLIDDTAAMAAIYATIMDASFLRVRFDVVDANASETPGAGEVAAQLICTYRGAGPRYGFAPEGERLERFETVPTGAPILLSGSIEREQPAFGFRHESPPLESAEESRLVLTIQSAEDPTGPPRRTLH